MAASARQRRRRIWVEATTAGRTSGVKAEAGRADLELTGKWLADVFARKLRGYCQETYFMCHVIY